MIKEMGHPLGLQELHEMITLWSLPFEDTGESYNRITCDLAYGQLGKHPIQPNNWILVKMAFKLQDASLLFSIIRICKVDGDQLALAHLSTIHEAPLKILMMTGNYL